MSFLRVLVTTEVTLSHTFYVDETPTAPTGTLAAVVKRLDGTSIVGSPFTYTMAGAVGSFALPEQAAVDILTVDWTGTLAGANVSIRDYVEVVGGFLFGLSEARAKHQSLSSTTTFPSSLLAAKRIETEQECERICRRAFVPRFARVALSGTDTDRLPLPLNLPLGGGSEVRAVRAVSVSGVVWSGADVAAVGFTDFGVLKRAGGAIWPAGTGNIIVEYEHGWDFPPADLSDANILRLRSKIGQTLTGVPERALSFELAGGNVFRLPVPGKRQIAGITYEQTGIPDVDAVYGLYARQPRAVFA